PPPSSTRFPYTTLFRSDIGEYTTMTAHSSHPVPRLGELEQQVMDLLWDASPRSVRDVMDALPHSPAYTTIATVMQNLRTKAMVDTRDRKSTRLNSSHVSISY